MEVKEETPEENQEQTPEQKHKGGKGKNKSDNSVDAATEKTPLKIELKEEFKMLEGTRMRSPALGRPVNISNVLANPRLYLRLEARKYVEQDGKGRYPLLNLFVLSDEQIKDLAKL